VVVAKEIVAVIGKKKMGESGDDRKLEIPCRPSRVLGPDRLLLRG
jgi:hypothetical protein